MTTPNRFQLTFDGRSYAVTVDGNDVSEHVAGVDVQAVPHDLPHVVLHLRPTRAWPAELDLLARVEVGASPDPGPAAAAFLEALDPLEVERAALARMDLENVPGGGTAAVLRQLVEWARGA
ncbi:glycogen/starch/alpha-glucan phosphorylase [Streptomyces sp. CC210A]|uniref:glycogen/starch/alpha-glucan phosphorylase n=1 Tax=Streptomyces sp. CC210A TaxID=2898184 RepID=UPI001F45C911|nr:glycogen/starch/alpha-glucan phosphorylase [Streptomyces sp. CC210A]